MDPDAADWLQSVSDEPETSTGVSAVQDEQSDWLSSSVTAGAPVPNPYSHILKEPGKSREYTHWARNKHLQYKYNEQYSVIYYNDCIDYMDKRLRGVKRDVPRPQEWGERVLRLYAKDGERLSANDVAYWFTTKNNTKPMYSIFHPVHSKEYYDRQYKSILC